MEIRLEKSESLTEKGTGFTFRVIRENQIYPAFTIRVGLKVKAYLNVCPHVGLRLNGSKNIFFCRNKNNLYCYSHGATFEPLTGICTDGPCKGMSLIPLKVKEMGGNIFLTDEQYKFYK